MISGRKVDMHIRPAKAGSDVVSVMRRLHGIATVPLANGISFCNLERTPICSLTW